MLARWAGNGRSAARSTAAGRECDAKLYSAEPKVARSCHSTAARTACCAVWTATWISSEELEVAIPDTIDGGDAALGLCRDRRGGRRLRYSWPAGADDAGYLHRADRGWRRKARAHHEGSRRR